MKKLLTILALLALSACTSGTISNAKKEDRLSAYGAAIRWGPFEKAQEFQDPAHRKRLDEAWLKDIHVTSYNPLHRKEAEGSSILEQMVEIRYMNEHEGVERSFVDRQTWRYFEPEDNWWLETDLPGFR